MEILLDFDKSPINFCILIVNKDLYTKMYEYTVMYEYFRVYLYNCRLQIMILILKFF